MANIKRILVGDTFKQIFVASGTDPSVIVASILDGDENVVSTGAGVNSLNGHFYRDVVAGVSSVGYYVSQWQATIAGKPYIRRRRFKAILSEVD